MSDDGGRSDQELEAKLALPKLNRRRRRTKAEPASPSLWARELSVAQAGQLARTSLKVVAPPRLEEVWVAQANAPRSSPEPEQTQATVPVTELVPEPLPQAVTPDVDADQHHPEPVAVASTVGTPATRPSTDVPPDAGASEPKRRRRLRLPKAPRLPRLPDFPGVQGRTAAVVTGVVVGLTGVLLVFLAELLRDAVRDGGSYGAAGFFLLLAIFALMVLEGAGMLRKFGIANHTSTSLLAVALLAVLIILVLLPVADRWWMVIVVPLLSAATFVASWWVSVTYGNERQHT